MGRPLDRHRCIRADRDDDEERDGVSLIRGRPGAEAVETRLRRRPPRIRVYRFVYALVLDLGENGTPNTIIGGGHYEDVYVKTAQGWRIKKRQFVPSRTQPPPREPAPGASTRPQP